MLDPFTQLLQYYWGHALALNVISKVLWVVSNIVGSCCISLHTTANMDATINSHCYVAENFFSTARSLIGYFVVT